MMFEKQAHYITTDGVGTLPHGCVGIVEVYEIGTGEHCQFRYNPNTRLIHIPNPESEMLTYRVLCQMEPAMR